MPDFARTVAKTIALRFLASGSAIERKVGAIQAAGVLTILNLHRVGPDDSSAYRPLDPRLFDALLGFVTQHFALVTFGDLEATAGSDRPRMILSFDDGYADFADHAAPLLRKHGVRVNHNIIPECVESGLPPLNVALQDFIGRAPMDAVRSLPIPGFEFGPTNSRFQLGDRLSNFIKGKPIAEQKALADQLLPELRQVEGFRPTPMMTLAQVKEMAATHEVGAHSFSHASLACETDDFVRDDALACRSWFADRLGQPMRVYAVPNGSYRPEQLESLREAGVDHVLLVDEDFSSPDARTHKRFTFWAHSRAEVRFRATGGFRRPGQRRQAA